MNRLPRILAVDDDPMNRIVVMEYLEDDYDLVVVESGQEALDTIPRFRPDVVLLDIMMPGLDGYETCRRIKSDPHSRHTKVILVSAKAMLEERLEGYEAGADDYVTKPFSPRELCLRVKAVLRRGATSEESHEHLQHHDLMLDIDRHRCLYRDEEVTLTAKEFGLLAALMRRPGRVQTRERLLEEVWGEGIAVTHRTVDTHMKRLREKLGEAGELIDTVRGVGYRFCE